MITKLTTISEAARLLHLSPADRVALYRATDKGKIPVQPSAEPGGPRRISLSDAEAWLAAKRQNQRPKNVREKPEPCPVPEVSAAPVEETASAVIEKAPADLNLTAMPTSKPTPTSTPTQKPTPKPKGPECSNAENERPPQPSANPNTNLPCPGRRDVPPADVAGASPSRGAETRPPDDDRDKPRTTSSVPHRDRQVRGKGRGGKGGKRTIVPLRKLKGFLRRLDFEDTKLIRDYLDKRLFLLPRRQRGQPASAQAAKHARPPAHA